jgi:hypothetical protein
MISIHRRTEKHKDGSIGRKLFVRVTSESLGPLDVLPARVPELAKGFARTREVVRANRSGTWAVWSCVDLRAVQ